MIATITILIAFYIILKPEKMKKAVITASNEDLELQGINQYLQNGNIVTLAAGISSGSSYTFVLNENQSKKVPITTKSLLYEDQIKRFKENPKNSVVPRKLYGTIVKIEKIIDSKTVRASFLHGNTYLIKISDLENL